jgi:hypothetical protein
MTTYTYNSSVRYQPTAGDTEEESEYERFETLVGKLIQVPKDEATGG